MLSLPGGFLLLPPQRDTASARIRRKVRLLALRRLLSGPLGGLRQPLMDLARQRTAPLLAAIGSPDVLCGLLVWERGLRPLPTILPTLLPDLLAALAPTALIEALRLDQPVHSVRCPRLGLLLHFSPPAKAMLADPSGLSFALQDGQKWSPDQPPPPGVTVTRAFHALHRDLPRLHLSTHDSNPLAMDEAHPEKSGNAISLGEQPLDAWIDRLHEALELIRLGLPEWWRTLPVSLERLLPVGYEPERHLSASYQEAPNMAYLTLHPDPLTMAEAIIHETQHGRLNSLMWLDAVLKNGSTAWSPSPVRPDLRPLSGVLLAAHAFVPVAALHARLASLSHPITDRPPFALRRAEVWESNQRALETLRSLSEPTTAGATLLRDLNTLHKATRKETVQIT